MSGESVPNPIRRIITTHPETDKDGSEVIVYDDNVTLKPVLNGSAHILPLYSTLSLPTTNPHHITQQLITSSQDQVKGVVLPNGVNCQVTDVSPNFKIGFHRTSSVDYNIFLKGSALLITPSVGGNEERREVKAGEVVVQTGTIHAWEAGPEGARWVSVLVSAKPVEKDGKVFEDVDF